MADSSERNGEKLLTATEMAAGFAAGTLSPVEVTRSALDAIDRLDPRYNAYCLVDPPAALSAAKASEKRWREKIPLGPLDGVPMSIKDMFLSHGWPTLRGSKCIEQKQDWDIDSPVTARLREGGLVLLGKTTTPELGWKGVTDSPLTGVTRNPWDMSMTSGGSSGGSAVAVATGMGTLSVGTDGGGSVRIPGSFCGIVGFKPTYGRIPLFPASAFGALAHAGPMARSVEDAATLLDVLSVPDFRDPTALEKPTQSFRQEAKLGGRRIRAAFSPTLGYVDVDNEVARLVADAVVKLSEAGVRVTETDPGFEDPRDAYWLLWATGAAKLLDTFPSGSAENLDHGLRDLGELGRTFSASEYLEANAQRAALGIHMGKFHTEYDVLITPTMPISPFAAGHDVPPGSGMSSWPEWTPFTYPFNMTQQPAITVPVGFTSAGLPVGLQIVGPRYADATVLGVAKLVEEIS